ncbi:hypothetical protein [Arthrobacter sp. 8AJ]|uniref:hypothetical protein n=1 Tax=Arthrobacter sp. 8AJ TaxID=2653130 RepID=UPI001359B9A5|nr:hypothetical protein [Arthrobacter sp. 8AJ]
MLSAEQLAQALKGMRAGSGITVAKVGLRPELRRTFDLDTDDEFISFIKERADELRGHPDCEAALVALGIGCKPTNTLKERRRAHVGASRQSSEDFEKTCGRREDRGFQEIAVRLIQERRASTGPDEATLWEMIQRCNTRIDTLSDQVAELTRIHNLSLEELSDFADKQKNLNAEALFIQQMTLDRFFDLFQIFLKYVNLKNDQNQAKSLLDRAFSLYRNASHYADTAQRERHIVTARKHLGQEPDPQSSSP